MTEEFAIPSKKLRIWGLAQPHTLYRWQIISGNPT